MKDTSCLIRSLAMSKDYFNRLIKLATKPLPTSPETPTVAGANYTDKQTRQRRAEDTSAKRSDKSRPDSASTETKNPQ